MPSSPSANPQSRLALVKGAFSFLLFPFLFLVLAPAQTQKPIASKTTPPRANELTLAGLRPGRDTVGKAKARFGTENMTDDGEVVTWTCIESVLILDLSGGKAIRSVMVSKNGMSVSSRNGLSSHETKQTPSSCLQITKKEIIEQGKVIGFKNLWSTGKGLSLGDSVARLQTLYGEPDSKSPSSKGGQQLELWYYAFDWAGADVPQVMEVLCTKERDERTGHVLEITLAAPSL